MEKRLLFVGLISVFVFIGCSEASADRTEEVAGADWTEKQISDRENDLEALEDRITQLHQDIRATGGSPSFSSTPLFDDVGKDYFAFEAIQYLAEERVIGGYSDGTFRPNLTITRHQTANMIANALGLEAPEDYTFQAKDIDEMKEEYRGLAALEYHGIMKGNNDGEMRPGDGLRRSQMATILVRAFDLPEASMNHSFTDIDEEFSGYDAINRIADARITTESGKAFRPNELTTRAQFSLFMARAMNDYFK
ncbi:S-layer homology domain-containing protein [Aliibacillus thermotolerans]|uniref:S-layer homology domain-containing protein n=1 Tax=Aliibacillus thermotolerans TaxID=1834418 RepID=A0ABW0U4U4_9BACI|nr:S-layer homology domain-containing protein [Aliibacillus thermotolerans]MDA3130934.1 hypothetical protein [Aliibacillus thermotolerans]